MRTLRVRKLTREGSAIADATGTVVCNCCNGCNRYYKQYVVKNPIGAKPGELVTVRPVWWRFVLDFILCFALPILLFTYGKGQYLLFLLSVLFSFLYGRTFARKNKYIITGYGQIRFKTVTKGDNYFD